MENQVKTQVSVKKVAPHYMETNPPKEHITVVRPCFNQHNREWSTRVIDEKGETIKVVRDQDEKVVLSAWANFMFIYHSIKDAKL